MNFFTLFSVALFACDVIAQFGNDPSGSPDFLRFGCSQLVVERSDPLVTPGMLPSPHMHQIVGGNSFNFSVRIVVCRWFTI